MAVPDMHGVKNIRNAPDYPENECRERFYRLLLQSIAGLV
jgi:hypothetical protein